MGWPWAIYGGLPRDEDEMRKFAVLHYAPPLACLGVGIVAPLFAVVSLPGVGLALFATPLFLLYGTALFLRERERVRFARQQLVNVIVP